MKTISKWSFLRRLSRLTGGCALGALMCATALAGPTFDRTTRSGRPHAAQNMPEQKKVVYYVMSSASAIPRPISYVIGGLLTTPTPIQIIGRGETVSR